MTLRISHDGKLFMGRALGRSQVSFAGLQPVLLTAWAARRLCFQFYRPNSLSRGEKVEIVLAAPFRRQLFHCCHSNGSESEHKFWRDSPYFTITTEMVFVLFPSSMLAADSADNKSIDRNWMLAK
jgi:hypothetical protein